MKKLLSTCLGIISASIVIAQTSLYNENFDNVPISMTASSTAGNPTWSLNSSYQTNGTNSDSAVVQLSDTLILESNTFSTMGFPFVTLEFDHICKIDFFDKAVIEYSTNNGSTWTQLTSTEYLGSGFLNGNAFSAVSYTVWNVGVGTAIPAASWWQSEQFDLAATGNQTQVKIRFVLIDADNNGARNNYGWLIDRVDVIGAPCELVPPTILPTGTIYQGAVFGTGPYQVRADVQDASGIASVSLDYTVNSGAPTSLTMTLQSGNIYQATIPAATVGDTICYTISATDNTTCSNQAQFPAMGCTQFIVNPSAPPNCLGNPVSNYNYAETFANFTPGNGRPFGGLGTFVNDWENSTADSHDWWVYNTTTRSTGTGPTNDHSPGDANYVYVEASGFSNQTAILNTPCYNFSGLNAPKFSFWYFMYGSGLGELHVDIFTNNAWQLDVTPAIIGDQGNQWLFREIDLTAYAGTIVQLRFRGIVGGNLLSDIAIDDIEIIEPIQTELALSAIVTPNASSCNGSANETVTVKVDNLGSQSQDTIPLAYSINGGPTVRDTAFLPALPSTSFNHTFQQTFDMSTPGTYTIDAWHELPLDGDNTNDSLFGFSVTTNNILSNFPDTVTFDNFTVGTPGTFLNGWGNNPSNSFDWFVNTGGTTSGQTGPSGDTTTSSGAGNYIYYEATNVPQGEEGSVFSGCLDINNLNKPELKFFYHMSGIEMGELHLDININGFLIKDIMPSISGDQGSGWIEQTIDLTPYRGDVRIVFRAIRGTGYRSDIAIDQVSIRDAQPLSLDRVGLGDNGTYTFPNPILNVLNVAAQEPSIIRIYNAVGEMILERNLSKGKTQIDTEAWSSGLYIVSVSNERGVKQVKLIKQ